MSGAADGVASLVELKDALRETLEARGSLGAVKARLRADIFHALDEQDSAAPKLSNENLLINELIREYLQFNEYRHTLSVLVPESGQPEEPAFTRDFLRSQLGIRPGEDSGRVPLLYLAMAKLQQDTTGLDQARPSHSAAPAAPAAPTAAAATATTTARPTVAPPARVETPGQRRLSEGAGHTGGPVLHFS
mmetsp:Transcript_18027/g.57655  ORF Transcript_18027/g.57655 Transcript_18027/m.57655 type:complete len:191 (-) Transcript_18027:562-1134(-)